MVRLAKSRALKADVSKYSKVDTGTEGAPQKQSSKMPEGKTRVSSGSVTSHPVKGTGTPSHAKSKMKKVRVTSSKTSNY